MVGGATDDGVTADSSTNIQSVKSAHLSQNFIVNQWGGVPLYVIKLPEQGNKAVNINCGSFYMG